LIGEVDLNYRRIEINDSEQSEYLLNKIAVWHNLTPKLWISDYKARAEDIEETIQRIRNTKKDDLFLAIAEDAQGQVQGFIWANKQEKPKDSIMIMSLYVTEENRGQGIATKLKILLEEWCRHKGIKTIETTTHYTNHNMIALNKKLGYVPGMVHMTKKL